MDFVVVGLTLGTLAVLTGVVLLGRETGRWHRLAAGADSSAAAQRCLAVAADRHSTGEAFLYAGAAIVLATVGAIAGSLDDRTGAFFVVTTISVAALGILLRAYLHRARHPIPVAPRRVTLPVPPAATADTRTSVMFADPPPDAENIAEDTDPSHAAAEATASSAGIASTAASDDTLDTEPVAVAASQRGTPDDTADPEPEDHKVVR